MRTRARRRLIGAAVLVSAAVVGLPLLFESKPRPVAVDTPISVARPGDLPVVSVPVIKPVAPEVSVASASASATIEPSAGQRGAVDSTSSPQQAGSEITEPRDPASRGVAVPSASPSTAKSDSPEHGRPALTQPEATKPLLPKPKAERADKTVRSPELATKPPSVKDDAARAQALLEGRESPPKIVKAPATGSGRFVVQVGAFSQASSAEAAMAQVGKLGLKAYSQDIETSGGTRTRVRLGPFASREEAERAAQRLKAAGQSAAVVPQ